MEKVVVQGNVSFNDKPIDYGMIRFYPTEGTLGPVSGAQIHQGRYEASGKGGIPVGTHRVEIQGFRAGQSAVAPEGSSLAAIPGGLEGPAEQYLPEEYNRQTTLTVVVKSSRKPITHDFHLKP